MPRESRSGCPINLTLEVLGDKWSLLILRDMMFGGKRHFRELLRSQEGIASNILSSRLARLVDEGLLTRSGDATHKQKALYSLTEKAIDLLPVIIGISNWGLRHLPVTDPFTTRASHLQAGGPALIEAMQTALRAEHLGISNDQPSPTVREILGNPFARPLPVPGQDKSPPR